MDSQFGYGQLTLAFPFLTMLFAIGQDGYTYPGHQILSRRLIHEPHVPTTFSDVVQLRTALVVPPAAAAEMRRGQQEAAISPLLKTPMPAAWLSSCVGEILAQQITVEAWTLGHAACTDSAAILTWERQDGATVAERPSGTVDRSGDTITQTIGFPASPNGSDNAQGLPASNIALQALLQPIGVSPQISEPVQPQPLPGATAAVPPPGLPPDPEETVTITLPVTPTLIHFDQIPGLRLDTLSINDDGDWILTGEIYGR